MTPSGSPQRRSPRMLAGGTRRAQGGIREAAAHFAQRALGARAAAGFSSSVVVDLDLMRCAGLRALCGGTAHAVHLALGSGCAARMAAAGLCLHALRRPSHVRAVAEQRQNLQWASTN